MVLGLPCVEDYLAGNGPYFGAIVGRYANRIANAAFVLDGVEHRLSANDGGNCLHGGRTGFDRHVWEIVKGGACDGAAAVVLRHTSPDGDEGFPGWLTAEVTYTVSSDTLRIDFHAETDRPTVVNLTSHLYWNLSGEGSGSIEDHVLRLAATHYVPVDDELIPLGEAAPVAGTPLDFTWPAAIGSRIRDPFDQLAVAHGYDHHFVLDHGDTRLLEPVAQLDDPRSGRRLEVSTTEPGIQVYSGNHLDGTLAGPSGRLYRQGDGIALETQHAPDSPNQPSFPSTVVRPDRPYTSATAFRLSAPS